MPAPLEAFLVAISLTATFVNGRKLWWGWFLTSATCISWTIYFTITDQWGPAVVQGVSAIITARNGAIWYRARRLQAVTNKRAAESRRRPHHTTKNRPTRSTLHRARTRTRAR